MKQAKAGGQRMTVIVVGIPPQVRVDDPLAMYKSAVQFRERKKEGEHRRRQQMRQRRRRVIRTVIITALIAVLALETGILTGLFLWL